jgi:hypothetical protein
MDTKALRVLLLVLEGWRSLANLPRSLSSKNMWAEIDPCLPGEYGMLFKDGDRGRLSRPGKGRGLLGPFRHDPETWRWAENSLRRLDAEAARSFTGKAFGLSVFQTSGSSLPRFSISPSATFFNATDPIPMRE